MFAGFTSKLSFCQASFKLNSTSSVSSIQNLLVIWLWLLLSSSPFKDVGKEVYMVSKFQMYGPKSIQDKDLDAT